MVAEPEMSVMTPDVVARAASILRATSGDRVREDLPLAPLTTFRIGGPAAIYLEAESDDDLVAASEALAGSGLPVAVLGKGSNVLIADDGFPGLVIRLGRGYRWASREGERLTAGGAMPLPALAGIAMRHGLAGLEFGVAIPATLGGAIRMNAGAHVRFMSDVVERVEMFRLGTGTRAAVLADDVGFAYRSSALPADAVIVGATSRLAEGEASDIREAMDEARRWRRRTQPLAEPNCGSVFTNPPAGPAAASLVEEVGAKGLRVGGASVSAKHANFIVTTDRATAGDVVALIERVREMVERRTGIRLELEVQLIGKVAHVEA